MHHQAGWLSEDAHALQIRLAEDTNNAALHCDLLIVGSGYGGAVAAARMAQSMLGGRPLRVIVVERGREYLPGMFPSRMGDLAGHVRYSQQDGEPPRGPATALWDLRMGKDVNVVLGSGLGGGSLINAAVMERPEASVWQNGWPTGIDGGQLDSAYTKAADMLQATPLPARITLPKLDALQHLADGLPGFPKVERCNLAVTFKKDAQVTAAGIQQQPCKLCGDCATGCNWQAKNSLDVNYLALAKQHGAAMYCGVLAHRIERLEGGNLEHGCWQLRWAPTDTSLSWAEDATPIQAKFLIVCAGSLGSTELLQRSQLSQPATVANDPRAKSIRFSAALGSRFSINGDLLAAAVKLPVKTQICADETTSFDGRNVGPTITGMVRAGEGSGRFVAQEFAIPAPLRTVLAELTASVGMLHDLPRFDWSLHSPWQRGAEPLSPDADALDHTMVYGLMGDDGARGRLEPTRPCAADAEPRSAAAKRRARVSKTGDELWDSRIAVQWPEARHEPIFDAQHDALNAAYQSAEQGWYLPNPMWRPLPDALDRLAQGKGMRGPLTTVHPLGGCPMGDSVEQGVVDGAGRVFDATSRAGLGRNTVFFGLAVLDGAIVPRSLGINPSLTIAALAENAVPELMRYWGLTVNSQAEPKPLGVRPDWKTPAPRPEQPATAIRLLEQVQGTLVLDGRRYWSEMQVRFTPIDDVAAFARRLPRRVPFEDVVLRLFADQRDRDDEPNWRAQRDVSVQPLFEMKLSGHAHVMFRHWSWFGCRVYRSYRNVGRTQRIGKPWARWPPRAIAEFFYGAWLKASVASNIGEQRGIDYLLQVDSASDPACPLQPGDRLRGRKLISNDLDSNPWRQVSEMAMEWRSRARHRVASREPLGVLRLDLHYFVRQHTALVALAAQPDMVTALADLSTLALFSARVMLKIQLLKFLPPDKRPRDSLARRPAELPGLTIERHDLRTRCAPDKVLLTRYRSEIEPPLGPPIVLFHGFTASGSTFAHPSIPRNLVQYLCSERRDVWVVELPTSIAFEKRDAKDRSFEEVADVMPNIVDFVTRQTDAAQVDVLGHCIGAAMFCRIVLRDARLHTQVRSLTLSQVGPLIQMSPANQLRGYLASYLAQYLGTKTLDARPSFEPGGAEGVGQTVLDAILASLPYPQRDLERALGDAATAAGRPDFRLVRHRADAMLGQLFELTHDSPMAAATLDALDDILGYARVQTLAQIIHYCRLSMLSDSDGRNREVTSDRLTERMGFPVLILHGRRSGVFDWRGSLESYEWLRRSHVPRLDFSKARVERNDEKLHMGLDTPRQLCIFEKFGHQDSMIGSRAATVVFPVIGEFQRWVGQQPVAAQRKPGFPPSIPSVPRRAAAQQTIVAARPGAIMGRGSLKAWTARLPAVGPIVGWLRPSDAVDMVDVSVVLRPSPVHARTRFVVVVPMRFVGGSWQQGQGGEFYRWCQQAREIVRVPRNDGGQEEGSLHDDPLGDALRRGPLRLQIAPAAVNGASTAYLLLTVHDDLPRRERSNMDEIKQAGRVPLVDQATKENAVKIFLANLPTNLDQGLLRLPPHVVEAEDRIFPGWNPADRTASLTLALASCQYPAGLLDDDLAQASYRRLARRLDTPAASGMPPPQLLLLLGDQVYVDETAGLFNPVTERLAFEQIYERSLALPAFRSVTTRLPTFMMLDDHEVRDNWQPPHDLLDKDDEEALHNFHDRQAGLNPMRPIVARASYSFSAAPGGWPLFVLDTRTRRAVRTPQDFDGFEILPAQELEDLLAQLDALERKSPGCPKLVAIPGVLLPLERSVNPLPGHNPEPRWSSDGWAGYPASRSRLLGEIARRGIYNVIFLQGDAHLSMAGTIELTVADKPAVRVFSVVSSGLYAPWRFANAEPANFVLQGRVALASAHSDVVHCEIDMTPHEPDAFAVIHLSRHKLIVEFDSASGISSVREMAFIWK